MKKIIVIAAAGKGKRLGADCPKCLVEVNGHAIFEYLLKAFEWADEIRMVVGYKAEEVMERVSAVNDKVIFVVNRDFENTTTLQSNYLGTENINEKVLFIDGDMIISKDTTDILLREYENGAEFVGVATDISEEPVYAQVDGDNVKWFDYRKTTKHEWANVALLQTNKLEYLPTHFFVQIKKYLPLKSVEIERLEIDTPADLHHTEAVVKDCPEKYDFWRNSI